MGERLDLILDFEKKLVTLIRDQVIATGFQAPGKIKGVVSVDIRRFAS